MAQTVCVIVSAADRERLRAISGDRNQSRKHMERARIVLASAERDRRSGSRRASASADRRYGAGSSATPRLGLKGCCATIAAQTTARVVALTCTTPPHEATHWMGRAMAKAIGISLRSVQRIWQVHQLQPHRIRTFKRSRDPSFAAKLADVVGL